MGKGGSSPAPKADRRYLRRQYRQLYSKAQEGKDVLCNVHDAALQTMLQQAGQLHTLVEKPKEHAVDSELFRTLTEFGLSMAKKARLADQGQTAADLVACLKTVYVHGSSPQERGADDPRAMDWQRLGWDVASYFQPACGVQCMLGPLDAQPKMRKTAVRRRREQPTQVERPTELGAIVEEEKQETDRNMEVMWAKLEEVGTVPFSHLVCNWTSFSQTVENIFTLSFLVRDQRVRLVPDSVRGLLVEPLVGDQAAAGPGNKDPAQFVMTFSMGDWDVMKTMVMPEECLLGSRPSHGAGRDVKVKAG